MDAIAHDGELRFSRTSVEARRDWRTNRCSAGVVTDQLGGAWHLSSWLHAAYASATAVDACDPASSILN